MPDFPFKINTVPFYAVASPQWGPYGRPAFYADGQPGPYGPGSFTVTINAIAGSPASFGGPMATSGTYSQLWNLWKDAFSTDDGVMTFVTYDSLTDAYITVKGRMKPPVQMSGGVAIGGVLIEVYNAFISDSTRATYTGGDPTPITTPPAYIPGDPLPAPDPALTYGYNIGRYNFGLYNQGEGV